MTKVSPYAAGGRSKRKIQPTVRTTDPKTSRDAAESIPEDALTEVKTLILKILREARREGIDGLTDPEIYSFYESEFAEGDVDTLPPYASIQKRRTDLRDEGFIEDSGERRTREPGPDGKQRKTLLIVWRLTDGKC